MKLDLSKSFDVITPNDHSDELLQQMNVSRLLKAGQVVELPGSLYTMQDGVRVKGIQPTLVSSYGFAPNAEKHYITGHCAVSV